jgi:hypothetical protein
MWMQTVIAFAAKHGPVVKGKGRPQIHHVVGRSYVHNKVPIGHWFIIPLPHELHDVSSNNPCNVTHYRKRFTEEYGMQRTLFELMVEIIRAEGYPVPPDEVLQAIQQTSY